MQEHSSHKPGSHLEIIDLIDCAEYCRCVALLCFLYQNVIFDAHETLSLGLGLQLSSVCSSNTLHII